MSENEAKTHAPCENCGVPVELTIYHTRNRYAVFCADCVGKMTAPPAVRIADLQRQLAAERERPERLEKALRLILVGKRQEDNEHPMGEWFSMAVRFMNIAREALLDEVAK